MSAPIAGTAEAPLRLCLMGNSHLAALRGGWGLVAGSHPGIIPTWFGAMHDGMDRLKYSGGVITPPTSVVADSFAHTSGGQRRIVLADYDAFCLVGMRLSFTSIARLYGTNRTIAQSQALRPKRLVSSSVFAAAMAGLIVDCTAMGLARLIRRRTRRPVILVADPLPGEIAAEGREAALWRHLAAVPDGALLYSAFQSLAAQVAADCGATFLPQPLATRAAFPFTQDALRRGAVRMHITGDTPFEEADVGHMGPAYGATVLDALRPLLPAAAVPA